MDRKDLLFNTTRKKKRTVIAPWIITFSPANPHFRKWISEEMTILHEEPKLKKLMPKIDVVTRQAPNIENKVIRSRHWKNRSANDPLPPPPRKFQIVPEKLCNV